MELELCSVLVPPYFSVSDSCEPSKDPFPMVACVLCRSPAVLQSCESLSLLTGVHFQAAVMA